MEVLVIEDDNLLLKTLEFKLKKDGFEVKTCANGYDAKYKLSESIPDIIITDIMMPFVNGLEIISFVRTELLSNVPIIVLSSAGLEKTVLEAFELGADDFITKPFSPNELTMRIKKNFMRNPIH